MELFVKAIRERLEAGETSVSALARESEITRQHLHRILAGTSIPSVDILERLAAALGLQVEFSEKPA